MKRTIALLLVTHIASTQPSLAHNSQFPGRGSRQAWDQALAYYNKGVAAQKSGKLDDALKLYETARSTYPYDGDFYDNAAGIYEDDKNDLVSADRLFQLGMAADPKNLHIKLRYVGLLIDEKKFADAAGWSKRLSAYSSQFGAPEKRMYAKLQQILKKARVK